MFLDLLLDQEILQGQAGLYHHLVPHHPFVQGYLVGLVNQVVPQGQLVLEILLTQLGQKIQMHLAVQVVQPDRLILGHLWIQEAQLVLYPL